MSGESSGEGSRISLENFDETAPSLVLSSPRSVRACRDLEVSPDELLKQPIEKFRGTTVDELVERKFELFERKRQARLELVLQRRADLIREEKLAERVREERRKYLTWVGETEKKKASRQRLAHERMMQAK